MIHVTVRRAREQQKLSQQSLADLAGVPRSQLQILEKGGNVTRETVEKLLAPLGLTLVAVSRSEIAAAREALRQVDALLEVLVGGAAESEPGEQPLRDRARGADAARVDYEPFISDETMRLITDLDAAVDSGKIKIEDET